MEILGRGYGWVRGGCGERAGGCEGKAWGRGYICAFRKYPFLFNQSR